MSNIILFTEGAKLPAYMQNKTALIAVNADVATGSSFPTLSIKGKVFTLVKDKQRKILTRPDDPDEVLQNINLAVVRANSKARVFYAKAYSEEDSEGAKPTCYSGDGVAPASDAAEPQAKKCQLCPHAVWGSKAGETGKGTACGVNTRLAVVDPDNPGDPWLLRVPAGSRSNFADACKLLDTRGVPYNAGVFKVGFDKEAPSPKLTFKPIGLVSDEVYTKISQGLYDSDDVKDIVGLLPRHGGESAPAPQVDADELDAALAAKAQAKALPAPKAKPAPAPKPAPVEDEDDEPAPAPAPAPVAAKPKPKAAAPAPAPAAQNSSDDLLGDLDALLGNLDD